MEFNFEAIKKWIPWAASAVIVVFSLLVFWGIITVVMKFLGASSYFDVHASDSSLTSASIKERNSKMSEFLRTREEARQQASSAWNLREGEKDPFKLQ